MSTATKKLALTAGHYMGTPGKRCLKDLDPNETREWWLNDRIADKIEALLAGYDGIEVLRTDDTTGQKDVSLAKRIAAANKFLADLYLSIHHNAGINGGSGGGIVAYRYTYASAKAAEWQKKLYDALIVQTGLKGNRATPLGVANLYECRETTMPAVLLELGFMDSSTDVPIILTERYADSCAAAIVEVLVNEWGLTKKVADGNSSGNTSNKTDNTSNSSNNAGVTVATLVELERVKAALETGKTDISTIIDNVISDIKKVIDDASSGIASE